MTLVQLRHLLALADSGSFSRAAEAVHLTQPALSRSIHLRVKTSHLRRENTRVVVDLRHQRASVDRREANTRQCLMCGTSS